MRDKRRAGRVLALVVAVAALAAPGSALAANLEVNATTDQSEPTPDDGSCDVGGGVCTLRAAIQTSQGTMNGGPDTIGFSPGLGTIELASELDLIDEQLTITGPGAASLTVDGNLAADWIFSSIAPASAPVEIVGLTITGGRHFPTINNDGVASGVRNALGTMLLDRVVITQNHVSASGNGANINAFGGGIYNAGTMTVRESAVGNNSAIANGLGTGAGGTAMGAGIYNDNAGLPTAVLVVERSTVSGNELTAIALPPMFGAGGTATAKGGGIASTGVSSLVLDRATVSNNTAGGVVANSGTGAAIAVGGGIFDDSASAESLEILSSTIKANAVGGSGAGPPTPSFAAANLAPSPNSTVRNTIVDKANSANCNAPVGTSGGYNLEARSDGGAANTCGFDHPMTDQTGVMNSGLDPTLAENGGPTKTHALIAGSPAIDKGDAAVGETIDQRGSGRPSEFTIMNATGGDGADIGAFEVRAPLPSFTTIEPGPVGAIDTPTIHGTTPVDATVQLFTDPTCAFPTGPATPDPGFVTPGITVDPVPHNATTTFYAQGTNGFGTSLCSSGPFPGSIAYTQVDPPPVTPVTPGTPPAATGLRAAALKKCKKKKGKARKKCRKRARKLPL